MTGTDIWRAGLAALALALSCALAGCGLLREPLPTPRPTTVVQVTADQVAQAMEADEFYATYGQTTLLVSGSVAAVDNQIYQAGHYVVALGTNTSALVLCDVGLQAPPVKVGDTITVRSADPEKDVSRLNGDVLIKNCTIPR